MILIDCFTFQECLIKNGELQSTFLKEVRDGVIRPASAASRRGRAVLGARVPLRGDARARCFNCVQATAVCLIRARRWDLSALAPKEAQVGDSSELNDIFILYC